MLEDLHLQLDGGGVGYPQRQPAVAAGLQGLLRVPDLVLDPAAALHREAQLGPAPLLGRKDAVGRAERGVERRFAELVAGFGQLLDRAQAVHREAARAAAQVAPGVDVPVAAVVDQPLRRELAFGGLVGAARPVAHPQPAPLHQRLRHRREGIPGGEPLPRREDAHAPAQFREGAAGIAQQLLQLTAQCRHRFREQARAHLLQQGVHGQQGVQLLGREPQARQLETGTARGVAVAVLRLVVLDGRAVAVAQVFHVAHEGRARDLQGVEEMLRGHAAAALEHAVDPVKTFAAFHVPGRWVGAGG